MRFLRTNTAVIVAVGPFFDKTDGVTLETALTITNERITLIAETDAGSAPTLVLDNIAGATSGTANDLNYITGGDNGMMQMELAAADVNRLGRMFLTITDAANHVPVFHEFMVLPAMIYDAFVLGTDVLDSSVTQWLGTAVPAPTVAGIPTVHADVIRGNTAQAGGGNTITLDAAASATNDIYNENVIFIVSGTGVSQSRIIIDYDGTTKVATVQDNWVTNPASGSVFIIAPFGTDPGTLPEIATAVTDRLDAGGSARIETILTNLNAIDVDITSVLARLPIRITKNIPFNSFPFKMVDSTDHVTAETGLAVTAQRMIDGAAFAACANAVVEDTVGWYHIDLAAADVNGDVIVLRFTAAGADPAEFIIVTNTT